LTKFFPTLWFVQSSTQTTQVFQENDLIGALSENGHKGKFQAKHKYIIRAFHPMGS
jgi:hypothetical protein